MDSTPLEWLLLAFDQAYDRTSWHGPNLRASLKGLTFELVLWRSDPARKNIAEIALHAAYWKYAAWRRLTAQPRGSFPIKGSNWFPRNAPYTPADWKQDLVLLDRMHVQLREAIAQTQPELLDQPLVRSPVTRGQLIQGVTAHDVYHAGQIQLIRRMHAASAGSSA